MPRGCGDAALKRSVVLVVARSSRAALVCAGISGTAANGATVSLRDSIGAGAAAGATQLCHTRSGACAVTRKCVARGVLPHLRTSFAPAGRVAVVVSRSQETTDHHLLKSWRFGSKLPSPRRASNRRRSRCSRAVCVWEVVSAKDLGAPWPPAVSVRCRLRGRFCFDFACRTVAWLGSRTPDDLRTPKGTRKPLESRSTSLAVEARVAPVPTPAPAPPPAPAPAPRPAPAASSSQEGSAGSASPG